MTMTQKILAHKAGLNEVKAGQLIFCELDIVLGNDITSPIAIAEFEKAGLENIKNPDSVCLVLDHFTPNKDIKSAQQCKCVRDFAKKHNIKNFFDVGKMGIEHSLLPEQGLVGPGDCIIGADSHTCTYGALGAFSTGVGSTDMAAGMHSGKCWFKVPKAIKFELTGKPGKYISGKDIILYIIGLIGVNGTLYKSMEFCGDGLKYLNIDDRFTIANMAVEAGAKNGIFPVDNITLDYIKNRFKREPKIFEADNDAEYEKTYVIKLDKLLPIVAFPHLPGNTKPVGSFPKTKIDQVLIGSCTNGRISDLRIAAEILKNKKVNENVRAIIIPSTNEIYLQALKEGLLEIFIKAGAIVSTPTCGPCLGGHMGILCEGERCLATTNRNFVGRMGHPESEVYLCSPAVAAFSAIAGEITFG